MRVGHGFDVHAFETGRPLVLGCVAIDHDRGLAGHSDADVIAHAVADALLGAAAIGDLGKHFPATGEWEGASGTSILEATSSLLSDAGFEIVNIDSTVVAQVPRLAPYIDQMVTNVSAALGIEPAMVSVKATTSDGLGFTGRGEGIACFSVALVQGIRVA